jgi:hypothetical protein
MDWRTDMKNAPTDTPHLRGVWVINARTQQPTYFEANSGYIDDSGEFVSFNGDEFGWHPSEYTHWSPLPDTPAPPTRDF